MRCSLTKGGWEGGAGGGKDDGDGHELVRPPLVQSVSHNGKEADFFFVGTDKSRTLRRRHGRRWAARAQPPNGASRSDPIKAEREREV